MSCVWKTALFILFIVCVFGQQSTCPGNCNGHGTCLLGICSCDTVWTGNDCSISLHTLSSGVSLEARTSAWTWDYYMIANPNTGSGIKVEIYPASSLDILSDCDIFVRKGELPTSGVYDGANTNWGTTATVIIEHADAARYYIGVYANFIRCHYRITATLTGACPQGCQHGACLNDGTCLCESGWGGLTCDDVIQGGTDLPLSTTVSGEVQLGKWVYYEVNLQEQRSYLSVVVNITSVPPELHDCDLYVRRGQPPTFINWDYKDASTLTSVTIDVPNALFGKWYIGIWGYKQCNFNLRASKIDSACLLTKCSKHGVCRQSCSCSVGYSGDYCQNKTAPLQTGEKVSGYVSRGSWNYYQYFVDGSQENIIITVNQDNSTVGDCDLFVRLDKSPSRVLYDYLDISLNPHFELEIEDVVLRTLYIGVYGWLSVGYDLQITKSSSCPNGCSHGQCVDGGTCLCDPGWFGTDCDVLSNNWLQSGQAVWGNITDENEWIYYQFSSTATTIIVSMKEEGYQSSLTGVLYLFVAEDKAPTLRSYNYLDIDLNKQFHTIQMILDNQEYKRSNWTIGVYGSTYVGGATPFQLVYWEPQQ